MKGQFMKGPLWDVPAGNHGRGFDFIKTNIQSKIMDATTVIPCRRISEGIGHSCSDKMYDFFHYFNYYCRLCPSKLNLVYSE